MIFIFSALLVNFVQKAKKKKRRREKKMRLLKKFASVNHPHSYCSVKILLCVCVFFFRNIYIHMYAKTALQFSFFSHTFFFASSFLSYRFFLSFSVSLHQIEIILIQIGLCFFYTMVLI